MDQNTHPAEEWWTDDQKALVEDPSSVWTRKKFEKVAGIWIKMDGGRMLRKMSEDEKIPEGAVLDAFAWDHEHCELCWQKISEYPSDQPEGYTDGYYWLCLECYHKYIGGSEKA
jgi:hypothetical protein